MIALGTMNVAGSMASCYVTTGGFARTVVNNMARCNTAVSKIVMSMVVLLTLHVITPLFKYTPSAILASIIISAVIGLFDYEAMILIWKVDKFDFFACMGAFFGVIFIPVEEGLLIVVVISFAKILHQVTRPRTVVLGKMPRTAVYRNIQQYSEATKVSGALIVRVDLAIYFSNSNYTFSYTHALLLLTAFELNYATFSELLAEYRDCSRKKRNSLNEVTSQNPVFDGRLVTCGSILVYYFHIICEYQTAI